MDALIIGGTGIIGAGVAKHLIARGATVTQFARGRRTLGALPGVRRIEGDRSRRAEFERTFERARYDVVYDLLCYDSLDAESTVRTFGGRCEHLVLCSTVCTYGASVPASVLVDETCPQTPVCNYGSEKVRCEQILAAAAAARRFQLTVVRPSHTYGPGGPLVDQLECDGVAWDRIARGLPVFCAGDGLGLWQPTHRDDCGKLFAYAALNPRTYGEAYNATGDEVVTWREYHRIVASVLGAPARLVFVPASFLLRRLPTRFGFLRDVTQFHGAYSSAKARAHVPEFVATVPFQEGARETLDDLRRRGALRDGANDVEYQRLIDDARALGFDAVEA